MLFVVGLALAALGVALTLNFRRERNHPTLEDQSDTTVDKNGVVIHKRPQPAGPAVRAYFGTLTDGSPLGPGKLVRVYDLASGRVKVTLSTADGTEFEAELLRADPAVAGVGNTGNVSIYLANGGNGSRPTNEAEAQVIAALANELATREQTGTRLAGLLTLTERQKHRQTSASDGGVPASDGGRP